MGLQTDMSRGSDFSQNICVICYTSNKKHWERERKKWTKMLNWGGISALLSYLILQKRKNKVEQYIFTSKNWRKKLWNYKWFPRVHVFTHVFLQIICGTYTSETDTFILIITWSLSHNWLETLLSNSNQSL